MKLRGKVAPLFKKANDTKELAQALKESKSTTIIHVIKKFNLNPRKDKIQIASKSEKLFKAIVQPLFIKRMDLLKANVVTTFCHNESSLHFKNIKNRKGKFVPGDTIYSRNVDGESWGEIHKKGGKQVIIKKAVGGKLIADVNLITPKGIIKGFEFTGSQEQFYKFLKQGANIKK